MATLKRKVPTEATVYADLTTTAGAYTALDVVGGLITFTGITANQPGKAEIREIILYDNDYEAKAMTLYLFDSAPTSIADNDAFTLSAADLRKLCCTPIPLVTHKPTGATVGVTYASELSRPIKTDGDAKLYGYLVAEVAPTYTATDSLRLALSLIEDIE